MSAPLPFAFRGKLCRCNQFEAEVISGFDKGEAIIAHTSDSITEGVAVTTRRA
jgi:hypothetical protein